MTHFEQLSERFYSLDKPIWIHPDYSPAYMKCEIDTLYKELVAYTRGYEMSRAEMELCSTIYHNKELKDKLKLAYDLYNDSNYYRIGRSPTITKARYRAMAKRLHPDKGGSTEAMQELNRQYKGAKL